MVIKKINAVLGMLIMLLLVAHVGSMTAHTMAGVDKALVHSILSEATAITMIGHAVLSMCTVIFMNDGFSNEHGKLNIRRIIQIISGILLLALFFLHVKDFEYHEAGIALESADKIFKCIKEVAFFAVIFTHVGTSFSRALVTLGRLESYKKSKKIDVVVGIICAIAFIGASVSNIIFIMR